MYEPSPAPRGKNSKGSRRPRNSTLAGYWQKKFDDMPSRRKPGPPIGARGFDVRQLASGAACEARADDLYDQREVARNK